MGAGGSNPSAGACRYRYTEPAFSHPCSAFHSLDVRVLLSRSQVDPRWILEETGVRVELNIRSNGTKVTDEMREVIDRKMERLGKLVTNVVDAQLELRTEKPRTGIEQTTAQLTLRTKRNVLRAEVRDVEPSKAIDAAIDKLLTQARKFSDKRARNRRRTPAVSESLAATPPVALNDRGLPLGAANDYGILTEDGFENEADILEDRVVRTKRFPMKPMHVDEAIDQLELIGHDFFLFLNADGGQFNVLYRRRDGDYGLLIPS